MSPGQRGLLPVTRAPLHSQASPCLAGSHSCLETRQMGPLLTSMPPTRPWCFRPRRLKLEMENKGSGKCLSQCVRSRVTPNRKMKILPATHTTLSIPGVLKGRQPRQQQKRPQQQFCGTPKKAQLSGPTHGHRSRGLGRAWQSVAP